MDVNQRFMYPQVVRSAPLRFRGFRHLDRSGCSIPTASTDRSAGRFANFAMNAATPWEQMQLADLFLRQDPRPSI